MIQPGLGHRTSYEEPGVLMTFCLSSIVKEFASTTPDAPALTFEDRTLSFSELNHRSSRVANALAGLGVGRQLQRGGLSGP